MKSRTVEILITAKDRTARVLKRISTNLKKWGIGATKIAASVVAGLGAVTGALTVMFGKLASAIDEQAKVASSLGIANEALGAMRDAAGYAGISTEGLTTSLRKMSQNVADAANGIGEGKDALEALGLNAEKLQTMKPEEAFTAIITELDKIPNGIKKTGIAMDLFGRSGAAMANLTSKGLKQAQKDAEDLGLKLNTSQAGAVEAANDAWGRIKIVVGDFFKLVTAKLAPGFKTAMDKAFAFLKGQDLKAWSDAITNGMKNAASGVINLLVPALSLALSAVEKVTMAFTGWKLLWSELQYQFGGFMEFVWTGLNKIREATNAMHDRAAAAGLASPDGNTEGKRIANEQKQILEMIAQKRKEALAVQDHELKKQGEQNKAFDDMRGKVETLDQKIKEFGTTAATTADGVVAGEKKKANAADLATEAYNRQFEAARRANAEILRGKVGGTISTVQDLQKTLEDGADK